MQSLAIFDHLSDDELLRRLDELVTHSRRVEADLVAHVGEVERRQLYAREASPSMFAYCCERLHLSEAEAYMRIRVARAARRHPLLLDMLRDGRLHLSGIVRLLPVLTRENRDALLARATHRSKRQILELVAELSPRPDVPACVRKLPQQRHSLPPPDGPVLVGSIVSVPSRGSLRSDAAVRQVLGSSSALAGVVAPWPSTGVALSLGPACGPIRGGEADRQADRISADPPVELCPDTVAALAVDPDGQLCPDTVAAAPPPAPSSSEPLGMGGVRPSEAGLSKPTARALVEPLSPGRYKVQFTASAELHARLERLRALMGSRLPDGDLATVIGYAVSETLARLEARRFAKTNAPRKSLSHTDTAPASRHVPAAVRRAVHERDGNRCGYVATQGRQCTERDRLEFHHRHPFGMGGDHSPRNVGLLCRAHNQLLARSDYGVLATGRPTRPVSPTQARGPGL